MRQLTALQLLLATFAGWVNRQQAQVIDYLIEENRPLCRSAWTAELPTSLERREPRSSDQATRHDYCGLDDLLSRF